MGFPWWGWVLGVLAVLVIGFFVMFGSWRYFRTGIRDQVLAFLAEQHPEIEIGEVTSESVIVTACSRVSCGVSGP